MRVRPISSCASRKSSGGSASALSLMTSTAVPPAPNTTTGPKVGSSAIPAISSRALRRRTIGWTVTPAMRASGLAALARARMSEAASATACALVRFSRTPPTSDLCTISGDRILTTAVPPLASSGAADPRGFVGIARERNRGRRDRIGREQRRDFDRIEPRLSGAQAPLARWRRARATSGRNSSGRLGGVAIKASCASR